MTALRWLLLALAGLASGVPSDLGGGGLPGVHDEVRGAIARLVRAAVPGDERSRLAATTLQSPGIGPEARRTRQPAASLGAPTFSKVVISPQGSSTFEGDGAPGSRVTVTIDGRVIGTQAVGPMGRWRVSLDRPLASGDHHIAAIARLEAGSQVLIGDEVRVAIPQDFSGSAVVAFDAARDGPAQRAAGGASEAARPADGAQMPAAQREGVRRRAEELAERANRGFDEIQRQSGAANVKPEGRELASRQPPDAASDAVEGSWTDHVLDWLHRSNRDFQREIAGKLARGPQAAETSSTESGTRPASPSVATPPDASADERARAAARERLFTEEEARRRAEREALAAQHRERPAVPTAEPRLPQARTLPQTPVDAAPTSPSGEQAVVLSEAELAAERAAAEEMERRIATRRKAAEESRLRSEARARENAAAEAIDRGRAEAEAQRRLAEERKAAEAKRLADEASLRRKAEEEAQRKLAEERKASEAKRLADEAALRRKAEEDAQRKLAEERKDMEARGLMAEEARRREAALRKQAEERMAAGNGKQSSEPALGVAEAKRKPAADKAPDGLARPDVGAGTIEVRRDGEVGRAGGGSSGRRSHSQVAEGSAEKGPVERADASDGRVPRAAVRPSRRPVPALCRGRKAGLRVELPGVYIVRYGDTLWAIARRHYGSGTRYPVIYRANRRSIADPDLIFPCQRLNLPRRGRRV